MLFQGIEINEYNLILEIGRRKSWEGKRLAQLWQSLEDSEKHVTTLDPDSS